MNRLKISIIGSNSFLATSLISCLCTGENQLALYGKHLPEVSSPNLRFTIFDWPEHPVDFNLLLDSDVIIYTAASGTQQSKETDHNTAYEVNSSYPIELFNFLHTNNFNGHTITFGSYFEIGSNNEHHFFSEKEVIASSNTAYDHYTLAKRKFSHFFSESTARFRHTHLILSTVYGPGENRNRLIPYVISSLLDRKSPELTSGKQVRQYIHVKEVCRIIEKIIYSNIASGIYNITHETPVTVQSLVETIYRKMDVPDTIRFGERKQQDEQYPVLLLSGTKLRSEVQMPPEITLDEGLLQYINVIKNNSIHH